MLITSVCFAQYPYNYTIRKVSTGRSQDMMDRVEELFAVETQTDFKDYRNDNMVQSINSERLANMKKSIKRGYYIIDDTLQQFVDGVLNRIIQENEITSESKHFILIADDASLTALCYGKGIFVINIGLLANINSEDQLAFVLAHEMAHDALGHIREKILKERTLRLGAKSKKFAQQVFSYNRNIDLEEIEEYRSTAYDVMRYSRTMETQADSLGLLYIGRAGYQKQAAIELLELLKEKQKPKYPIGVDFFLPFDSPQYPFQSYWLNDRANIFNASRKGSTNVFSYDSLQTHPDLEKRQLYLAAANYPVPQHTFDKQTDSYKSIALAEMQVIQSALRAGKYDLTLYYAMQMLKKYPKNAFVINRIAAALVYTLVAKDENIFTSIVSPYTRTYNEELRLINNFLYNLERKELGEVAYYFMKREDHFNPNERSHYYLLWRICDLTYRYTEKNALAKTYSTKFNSDISTFNFKK
ncbi:MAG TPA: M48 family metallopeptidase [Ohtaekwangia sp.]|uniref:M48 family metallopeptidase n=1 Tax=Ohtaekwangia sp. TaxID=2066019 RepID=UPI002F9509C3